MAKNDNVIKLYDTVTIAPGAVDTFLKNVQDNVFGMPGQGKPLLVDIIATHAGRPTRNHGLYLPQKMRDGANTFVTPYPKPVLTHHNTHADPIGRVVAAKYIDTSATFPRNSSQDMAIKALCNANTSFIQSLQLLDGLNDSALLDDPTYPGLGHILITAEITDEEAIKKFLDKRYVTVSIGAATDKAVCSVCKKDWVEDGFCDHQPGKEYDGKVCRIIAGNLTYDEVSPVNVPADTLAQVVALHNSTTIQNSVVVADSKPVIVMPIFRVGDAMGGNQMAQEPVSISTPPVAPDQPVDAVPAVVTSPVAEPQPEPVVQPQDQTVPEPDVQVLDESDKHYEDMIEFGWQLSLFDTGFEDAKLTPEQRRGMKKSTFCKPAERKYPVPDCNHARVAMAYAKKYNESSAVIACIRRKASALGCPLGGKDCFDEKEIDMLLAELTQTEAQDKVVKQPEAPAVPATEQVVKPVEQTACTSCDDALKAAKQELVDITAELKELQQVHVDQVTQFKTALADTVVRLEMVAGQQIADIEQATASIVCMTMDDLIKKVDSLKGNLKMDVVIAKINDGMTQVPQGTVEDPTVSAQTVTDPSSHTEDPAVKMAAFYKTYHSMKEKYGLADARKYLTNLRGAGLVSREFDPEKT